jgi:hypothetical protein
MKSSKKKENPLHSNKKTKFKFKRRTTSPRAKKPQNNQFKFKKEEPHPRAQKKTKTNRSINHHTHNSKDEQTPS